MTVGAAAGPDLVVTSVGNPPASAAPGKAFAITNTVKNQGATTAAQSTTRFYLSLDDAKDAGDTLLTGSRAVATLAAGAQSAGTTTVTIPLTAPPGTYRLLACADDTQVVAEASDANNCRAAAATIVVGRPDLVETAVSNPPAAARPGTSFAVTDTVRNQGTLTASGSAIRYYLSADAQKSPDDRLLTGSRSVPTLAPGAASTQTVTVTIPPATPPGAYVLLACADDTKLVVESDEGNNCLASAGAVTVALPDLVQQTVSSSGGPFRRGTAFTVSDTVLNDSRVGTPSTATTRYYLSLGRRQECGRHPAHRRPDRPDPRAVRLIVRVHRRHHPLGHSPGDIRPPGLRRRHQGSRREQRHQQLPRVRHGGRGRPLRKDEQCPLSEAAMQLTPYTRRSRP